MFLMYTRAYQTGGRDPARGRVTNFRGRTEYTPVQILRKVLRTCNCIVYAVVIFKLLKLVQLRKHHS